MFVMISRIHYPLEQILKRTNGEKISIISVPLPIISHRNQYLGSRFSIYLTEAEAFNDVDSATLFLSFDAADDDDGEGAV